MRQQPNANDPCIHYRQITRTLTHTHFKFTFLCLSRIIKLSNSNHFTKTTRIMTSNQLCLQISLKHVKWLDKSCKYRQKRKANVYISLETGRLSTNSYSFPPLRMVIKETGVTISDIYTESEKHSLRRRKWIFFSHETCQKSEQICCHVCKTVTVRNRSCEVCRGMVY